MNILLVTHYFTPHVGGIEIVAYNQARELVKKGHSVTIVTSHLAGEVEVKSLAGIQIRRVPAWNGLEQRRGVPYPIFSWRLFPLLWREIAACDVLHVHGVLYMGSWISALFARLTHKPLFVTEHVGFVAYKSPILNGIERLALQTIGRFTLRASAAVFVLNALTYQWARRHVNNVQMLPNGVDLELFHPATPQEKATIRARYAFAPEDFLVLFVGRFVTKKGFDVLYRAKDGSYTLVFAGGDNAPETLKADPSVRVLGCLTQHELAMVYQACDVFVLPSQGEGFPLSIQEAMASGLPIITSNDNKLEQLSGQVQILYTEISAESIAAAIRKVQDDRQLRQTMGAYSEEVAHTHFSWHRHCQDLLSAYEQYGRLSLSTLSEEQSPWREHDTGHNQLG